MNITEKRWLVNKELTLQEREILFIIAESAGMRVYHLTRSHTSMVEFPYIGFDGKYLIGYDNGISDMMTVTYDDIINSLREIINNERDQRYNIQGDENTPGK